jgi:uncharacterized protein YcbK (DUF882 family)
MMKKAYFIGFFGIMIMLLAGCSSSFPGSKSPSSSGAAFAAAYTMDKTKPDPIAARRIVLLHPESGESLDVVYYHDEHYDRKILDKINYLFRDRHANQIGVIDPELIDYLVDIRTRFNLPPTVTFEILNGYRTPETNARMAKTNKNVAIESLHVHGWAVDFRIPGVDGRAICEIAKTMQRGGVAYYPKSHHVHVDLGNIRTWKEK